MRTRFTLTAIGFGALGAIALLTTEVRAASWVLVQEGTALRYLKGTQTPAPAWITNTFQPGPDWIESTAGFGIGYGDGDDATVLTDMANGYLTVYVRSHFTVGAELSSIKSLSIQLKYDDGFAAWLNGVELGRASLPSGALQASTPASGHEVTDSTAVFQIDPSVLMSGDNVLAIEVHNASLGSSDLSMIPTLLATDGEPVVDAVIKRGPFLQQVGRRSALVVWETDQPAASTVTYGTTAAMGLSVENAAPVVHHVVKLEGLAPDTVHHYQVQSVAIPSAVGQFTTEPNLADPIRMVAYGDTRSNHGDHGDVVAGMVKDQPMVGMHVGDLVASGSSESDWDMFFQVEKPLLRDMPLYPAPGNHEGTGPLYTNIFELPENSPSPERYYTFRYGPVRVWILDQYSNDYDEGSEQHTWFSQSLETTAADPSIRHRIVILHHGPYSSASHGSNLTVRSDLNPLFEKYGVEVVFSGHDHDYERSTVNGVKYVVTGGGGAPLYSVPGASWTEAKERVLEYCLVDVHGPRLEVTCKRLDGTTLDSFVFGASASECTASSECAGQAHQPCEPDEQGAWECVEQGCVWNCVFAAPQSDAGTEAGVDGSAPDASVQPADAGESSDAGAWGQDGAAGSEGGASTQVGGGEGDGGCGCELSGRSARGATGAGWLALVGAWLLRRARGARSATRATRAG